ncbi:RNase H-like domain found in reverse transcriptase [Popillia japonica]|uniref:RNase H-like domain found in reverse transcriptase n=1 Tax=Popillia japonica TaxID=7064 RepID=A0AAW1LD79_POPJA
MGIKPLGKYVEVIRSSLKPVTVEKVQSFLGLINSVGKWIPNLATDLQDNAFQGLKESLSRMRTLGYYNALDRTEVVADASPVGLGAVLIQINQDGPRVIAYGNKSLTHCEKRYCQTEKEALALVWAVERFKIYLLGEEFELISDHKPLDTIFETKSKPCARIERWVLRPPAYKYKIIYRPGRTNIAESLSRLC